MKRSLSWTNWIWVCSLVAMLSACGDTQPQIPDSPDGTVEVVMEGLETHEPHVAWAALPASYQRDITSLIHDMAEQTDAELHNRMFEVAGKAVAVMRDKQQFIFDHPMAAMVDRAELEKQWPAVVALCEVVVNSELADVDQLRKLNVDQFLRGTGSKVMQHAAAISALSPGDPLAKLKALQVELVDHDGDNANVRLTSGENTEIVAMTRVEGRWIPTEMATDWSTNIAEARADLVESESANVQQMKPMIIGVLATVEAVLDQLSAATTQEQFNQALELAF